MRECPTEHHEQCALMLWARINAAAYPQLGDIFAIPNGGARDIRTGAKLKREGVKKGVPDLFLPYPAGGWHGLFIEMKAINGSATREQKKIHARLEAAGYRVIVPNGWHEATKMILDYFTQKEGAT